jgi:hypothetical protein
VGIVNETVQDGVGIGRIADYFVPSVYWKLGGNHRRAASVAFLEDFQKIVTGGGVERLQAPVIENEQIGAAQVAQKTRMASVATPQGEGLEEPGHALIKDRAVVATRLVAERRGQPALADAGQDSVTMPGVRRSRSGSTIRFILDAARWCRSRSGGGSQARITWSWFSQTARSLWSRPGWRRQWLALPLSPRALGYRSVGSSSCAHDSIRF